MARFLWLVIGNAIGVMLALLLLFPSLNAVLGEWTYGRWMMVHVNILLYGWCSLPMLGWLFRIYGADRGPAAAWCRPVLWTWSAALFVGSLTWLAGHSSGKLFLDWSGYARYRLSRRHACAVAAARRLSCPRLEFRPQQILVRTRDKDHRPRHSPCGSIRNLHRFEPRLYPAINPVNWWPHRRKPTGVISRRCRHSADRSLRRSPPQARPPMAAHAFPPIVFAAEALLCLSMNRGDISHHLPSQYLSLGSLLVWLPLVPAYYATFQWHDNTRGWRTSLLWWWGLLVVSGWIMFLPGVLDHFKFTDGLVGHSLVAVAGFLTALLAVVLVQLLGDDGWILTRRWSFHMWNWSVLAYVVLMLIAGWIEGSDPAFTIVPGVTRNILYSLRLVTGILMLISSAEWLIAASALLRASGLTERPREVIV